MGESEDNIMAKMVKLTREERRNLFEEENRLERESLSELFGLNRGYNATKQYGFAETEREGKEWY